MRWNRPEFRIKISNRFDVRTFKIKDDVFIGAYSFVLKGVTIGNNSIIGACSVVTKNVPDNEIWAGNPAKFIRKNNFKTNDSTEKR